MPTVPMSRRRPTLEETTRTRLRELHAALRTERGQNFLVDGDALDEVVRSADVHPEDVVVEVGGGLGTLTEPLVERARKVYVFEVEPGFQVCLNERFGDAPSFELVAAPFDRGILEEILGREDGSPIKIVANLPYQISTAFLTTVLDLIGKFVFVVVMLQLEVARRLRAQPGTKDYGSLSLFAQTYANPEIVHFVPRTSFYPMPQVDSAVVRIWPKSERLSIESPATYFSLIEEAFRYRRKTILNAFVLGFPHLNRERILELLVSAAIDPQRRGETLSIEEYIRLSETFSRA